MRQQLRLKQVQCMCMGSKCKAVCEYSPSFRLIQSFEVITSVIAQRAPSQTFNLPSITLFTQLVSYYGVLSKMSHESKFSH